MSKARKREEQADPSWADVREKLPKVGRDPFDLLGMCRLVTDPKKAHLMKSHQRGHYEEISLSVPL